MVNIFDAYRVLNQSVLDVIDDCVSLNVAEVETKQPQYRMEENPYSIAEKYERIAPVVVAHNVSQYTNRFYSIQLSTVEVCLLDILIHLNRDEVDLREFGGELCI